MWIPFVSSIFVLTFVSPALSKENGISQTSVTPKISEFKNSIHRILEGARIRKKRQLEESGPLIHKVKLDVATPWELPYLSDYSITFWIPVETKQNTKNILVGTTSGHIILFAVSNENDKIAEIVALSEQEDVAIKAKAFTYYDEQWFAVLHQSSNGYYLRMYTRIGRGLEKLQKIDLTGPSDIELVTMKGISYLIVASYSSKVGQSISYQSSTTLYHWARTQFDAIASRMTYGARSVDCWILDGSLYIAVAQEINDERNRDIGSPVFLYNSKEENRLVLWENLQTSGPTKVRHFNVAGSHYLVVIGGQDTAIYWWSNGQFLKWQSLSHTAGASDVSVLALGDGEVAIAIALQGEALFYTLDSSGLYIITLTMSLGGSNLKSLQFLQSGAAFYALALFEESRYSIWKLNLASHYLPSVQSLDALQQCLEDTKQLLDSRKTELEIMRQDISRVWQKESRQNITSDVFIKGNIISKNATEITHVTIFRRANIPDTSMSSVISSLGDLSELAEEAKLNLSGAVLKSTRQDIRGFKFFEDHVYIPSLTLEDTLNDVTINDLKVSRLQNYALRKAGDQIFSDAVTVSNMYSESAKVSALNGVSTDDFLLLHGEQIASGSLTFSSVSASDVWVNRLNSIPTEEMVTTNTPQNISSLKTFAVIESVSIDVKGETNEVDLSSTFEKIATVDEHNDFLGKLTFLYPVTFTGDIFLAGKINKNIDVSTLADKSVKVDTDQQLTGWYTLKGQHAVDGDLLVGGSINDVSLDNLLTVSSNQQIYADVSFSEPLTLERDLTVDAINGVDLSEEAVRKTISPQFVMGQKIFTNNIDADFVDMTDYVTLDGVDPSLLIQDIVRHNQGVIEQNQTVLNNVEVLENLHVRGGINGMDVQDFSSSVWLRSVEQNITAPITIDFVHFGDDLDVQTANGLSLETDIVHTFSDEVIESNKTFSNKIVWDSVKTSGAINGFDMRNLKIQLDEYENEWEVRGTKTITSLGIAGNLKVTTLNSLEVADILRPSAKQTVRGPVKFVEKITYIQGDLSSGDISFETVNGMNLKEYFRNAVLLTQPHKRLENKHFDSLKATNMSIPASSSIAGISLDEILRKSVTLNDAQLITAPKTFGSTLNFKRLSNTGTVNGLVLDDFLSQVVLTDEFSQISNKRFLGDVQTTNAFVRGEVNGMKLEDMASGVFYKSEDNVVTKRFIFEGDIDVGDLYAPEIDGVAWTDMIFLQNNEVLKDAWFLSKVYADGDIFINGLLNGCDLSQISTSLEANKFTQVINKDISVQNIVIEGNLVVKKAVNKISIKDFQNLITIADDQIINSDVIIDANHLIIERLNLTDSTNSDLMFIMQDAVRHSIPQTIMGEKTFKENVDVTVLLAKDVFATKVNDVNLEELEAATVWKNGHQVIAGDKILPSLIANVVTINGYLNGLKLPEDVVRTDVSEHISHPTYFMSELYVLTELTVDGLIDGINLNDLIHRRITRSTEQNITAALIFHDDVIMYDDLTIDGTVNEVVLELVAKARPIHPVYPLQGYKIFNELHISGPVTASSVNDINLTALSKNVVVYNKDEHINEIQVFEKSIHAQNSIFVEWINDIPIRQLTAALSTMMSNLQSVLDYLHDLTTDLQELLSHQMSTTQEQLHEYAYFTLFQEIDVGPSTQILYGYNLEYSDRRFSHSLVMWTERKHCVFMEKCCHLQFSYWLRVQKNGVAMVDGSADSGRYFPIPSRSVHAAEKEFFIWTNSSDIQPQWCSNKGGKMVLASNNGGQQEVHIDFENPAVLSEVKSFRKNNLYAVASFYFDPKNDEFSTVVVYEYDGKRHWFEHQILPSFGVLSLDIIHYSQGYKDDVLLVLGTGMKTEPSSHSAVYKWNNKDKYFDLLQHIPSQYVTSTLWIEKERDLLLAFASVDHWPNKGTGCSESVSGGQINIYSYGENLEWIQSIPVGGVVSMVSFSVSGDTYLAAGSVQHQTIYIFQWRGYSKFVEIQTISADVRHLNIYYIDDDVYMTVASISGPSKILKMVRRGKGSKTVVSFDPDSLEQQDEVPEVAKVVRGC